MAVGLGCRWGEGGRGGFRVLEFRAQGLGFRVSPMESRHELVHGLARMKG